MLMRHLFGRRLARRGIVAVSVIVAFGFVLGSAPGVWGCENDDAGDAPSVNIAEQTGKTIAGGTKTGRNIALQLKANAEDWDLHLVEATCYVPAEDDIAEYEWVVPEGICKDPPNPTNAETLDFTTIKTGALPPAKTFKVKIKDAGNHYPDFEELTEIANGWTIQVVDPDDVALTEGDVAVTIYYTAPPNRVPYGAGLTVTHTFQLKYNGENLPWAGEVREQLGPIPFPALKANNATKTTALGDGDGLGGITNADQNGSFSDTHQRGFYAPYQDGPPPNVPNVPPNAGKYHVQSHRQRWRNQEAGELFGPTFKFHYWLADDLTGGLETE
jgi:hypothetical protein